MAFLTKMYKSKEFRKIKQKAVIGGIIYVVTNDLRKNSELELINIEDFKLSESENELFLKYDCKDLATYSTEIEFYSKLLYFYDCVIQVTNSFRKFTEEEMEEYLFWTGHLFKSCHGKGTENTMFEDASDGLKELNKYLALRSCMIGHRL